jgi:hypothetical protein
MVLAALVACIALTSACTKDAPKSTRWDDAAAPVLTVAVTTADAAPAAPAGSLNKFFPKDGDGGYKRVFTADKDGYAEAKLQKDGKDVATVSISDAERLAAAKGKFEDAKEKLEGFPLMTVGKNQSTVLVKDRFQVKVSSQTLDHDARKAILSTFDLKGLGT